MRVPTVWSMAAFVVVLSCFVGPSIALAGDAAHAPYIVRGNNHILIGVSLDEAAVRAALPAGMEPTEGITGGYNVYRSDGGYGSPAYTRAYVWADIEGYDSASGAKGRWILWGVHGPGAAEVRQTDGYDFEEGSAALIRQGTIFSGVVTHNGTEILRVAIERADGACSPAAGTLNYPVRMPAGNLAMHQYPFTGDVCGASPISLELLVDDNHPMAKFKPTALVWAAEVKNLSFAGFTVALE